MSMKKSFHVYSPFPQNIHNVRGLPMIAPFAADIVLNTTLNFGMVHYEIRSLSDAMIFYDNVVPEEKEVGFTKVSFIMPALKY